MRIALLAPLVSPIAPPFLGGAQVLIADLAAGLAARGHEVTLYAAAGSRVSGAHLVTLDVADLDLPPMRVLPSRTHEQYMPPLGAADDDGSEGFDPLEHDPASTLSADAFQQAFRLVRQHAAEHDVLHAHASDWPAYAYAANQPLPVIHTLHAPAVDPIILRVLLRLAPVHGQHSARLVTVSRACAVTYAPYCHISAVIYNGLPLDDIPFAPSPDRAAPYLLYAGRITPEKGVEDAFEIAARAGVPLVIAGGIYDQAYYEERILPRLEATGSSARYLGALSRETLWHVMGDALAVLYPVLWEEPFGLIAAEANATGTPVVAYARGGLPEVIADGVTGRLIAPGDVDAAAASIAEVAAFDRAACRAHIARRFGLDAMLDAYEAFYAETIAQAGA